MTMDHFKAFHSNKINVVPYILGLVNDKALFLVFSFFFLLSMDRMYKLCCLHAGHGKDYYFQNTLIIYIIEELLSSLKEILLLSCLFPPQRYVKTRLYLFSWRKMTIYFFQRYIRTGYAFLLFSWRIVIIYLQIFNIFYLCDFCILS